MEGNVELLKGSGKVMRVLPLTSIAKDIIEYCLNQAPAINQK
jgi:hypothetical protein